MSYIVDVLIFAGTYIRGQLSPTQFAGIKIRATSTGCENVRCTHASLYIFQFAGINIRGDRKNCKN